MNDHILLVRFHYTKDDPRFEWRFNYFKDIVLPRILNQTFQNFDIGIWCNKWHEDLFKSLSDKIITFQVKEQHTSFKHKYGKKYFFDFVPWKNIVGLRKYKIQSGLDSDDLISCDYIEIIEREFGKLINKNSSCHLFFQPELYNLETGKEERIHNRYSTRKGSAFMSLYQPDENNYHFIYEQSHLTLPRIAEQHLFIGSGKCWASVHKINESTGKYS